MKIIGDSHGPVRIGSRVQILENTVLHLLPDNELIIDDDAVIGPGAMIHGCHIGRGSIVEPGAIVCDGSVIGAESVVRAGACVKQRDRSVTRPSWMASRPGSPVPCPVRRRAGLGAAPRRGRNPAQGPTVIAPAQVSLVQRSSRSVHPGASALRFWLQCVGVHVGPSLGVGAGRRWRYRSGADTTRPAENGSGPFIGINLSSTEQAVSAPRDRMPGGYQPPLTRPCHLSLLEHL